MLGQGLDLGMQRLDLITAGDTQAGNGAIKALVESLFELAPLFQGQILDIFNPRARGRCRRFNALGHFVPGILGQFFGLFAILDQGVEELAAIGINFRVHTQTSQPDFS